MSEQHTPRPWVPERSCSGKSPDAGCAIIASYKELSISNPSRGIVAWATRHVGQTSAEVEANARLIAAAPDLLAALRDLVAICDGKLPKERRLPIEAARTAITKATNPTAK